ncbi:thioredoxin domain-containing protein [Stigmatella sp. ncwal1]|uniref:Thioredoxin domain-containing protein n=1 Tax=Stigmatella ashevillensis TaxID=2995309 RepID=A0ABT5DLG6_9BACT|nr:thioredoxin domain-containing protein [Stigmatella ashevillena]MDC0713207.1 thioredoxin domain-containing protein [Stigmatella ashevillena]
MWSRSAPSDASKAATAQAAAAPAAPAPAAPAPAAPPQRQLVSSTVFKVPLDDSPSQGPADALVTLVEFTDFQCPFCSRANASVKQVLEDYNGQLRVVVKQHPLAFHPRARPAALAALAAHEQGKFWAYHDKLFANQKALDDASLETYAKEVGLDIKRWKKDMADSKLAQAVDRDTALAVSLGAGGTPGFFVNGRFFSGAQPIEVFRAVIEEELGKAAMLVKEGMKPSDVYASVLAHGASAPPPPPEPPAQKVELGTAPAKGPSDAPVTLVAFSDFECPFCSRAANTVKQLEGEYQGKLRVAFKHQPLPRHANAKLAATASLAAHEQGKFWEYHDKLFANQTALDRPALERYAEELKLDMGKFKEALDSNKFDAQISADSAQGQQIGAAGTPTFFVNGRPIVGAKPIENFRRVIDDELRKAGVAAR